MAATLPFRYGFPVIRVRHVTDRLSARGGADWHLLGVIRSQIEAWGADAVRLAVGQVDGTVPAPPCPVEVVPGLEARVRAPVDPGPLLGPAALIHVHNVVNPAALERLVRAGRPVVATVQDHRSFCPGRGKWTAADEVCREPFGPARCAGCFGASEKERRYLAAMLELTRDRLAALREVSAVTVLSRYMKRELVTAGLAAERVHVIPPFVHGLEDGEAEAGPPCALFVGRLVEAKGPLDAVEAWRRSGLDLPLVLAGTGSARERIAERAPEVELCGWVPHERLAGLYRRARLLLMPCRWQEPFGIVGLEALSRGVPVAAWDSGGVREWHPGPGLAPWGDVDALARAAREVVGGATPPPRGFERDALMDRLHALYLAVAP